MSDAVMTSLVVLGVQALVLIAAIIICWRRR